MKRDPHKLKDKVKPQFTKNPEERTCRNCLKGKRIGLTQDVLCREKGIVSEDYFCTSHRYFVLEDFNKIDFFHCSDCEFFVFHPHDTIQAYGVCKLFSVRKCDGRKKKACSKFVRREAYTA
jgi:hypothetical protein